MDVEAIHRNLKRILACLGFPEVDSLDLLAPGAISPYSPSTTATTATAAPSAATTPGALVRVVVWLEDRKIRGLEVQERDGIRNPTSALEWDKAMQKYMEVLESPVPWSRASPAAALQGLYWLASHAVALDYEDHAETLRDYEDKAASAMDVDVAGGGEGEEQQQNNSNAASVAALADRLGALLGLSRAAGETDQDLLRRCERSVRLLLSPEALAVITGGSNTDVKGTAATTAAAATSSSSSSSAAAVSAEGLRSSLDADFPLGFDTGNPRVNRAAVVLRMLYLLDLGDLQRDFNALVALGQQYTADPSFVPNFSVFTAPLHDMARETFNWDATTWKTNTAMGKVGR